MLLTEAPISVDTSARVGPEVTTPTRWSVSSMPPEGEGAMGPRRSVWPFLSAFCAFVGTVVVTSIPAEAQSGATRVKPRTTQEPRPEIKKKPAMPVTPEIDRARAEVERMASDASSLTPPPDVGSDGRIFGGGGGAWTPQEAEKAAAVQEAASSQTSPPPSASQDDEKHFSPMPSRWYQPPLPWALLPPPIYEINEPGRWWDPYRQNLLKGDFPIVGEDVFFMLTFTEKLLVEGRNIPTGSGITGPNPGNQDFFGDGNQLVFVSKTAISFDVFKGQQAFKPVDWRVRVTPVIDVTSVHIQEVGGININVSDGRDRTTGDIALQEALVEIHLFDLTDRYDFISSEFGILPFRSDFRGFIFDDTNLGVRLFGNYDNNYWQYNLVFFDMLEKDTFSELNRLDLDRDQQVFIANVFKQDFLGFLGYTASFSIHYNHDGPSTHFDRADFLVRPAPIGLARESEIDAVYLGWAGEGRIQKFNITHAFYQVVGEQTNNAIATQDVDINAQFGAVEISYDIDWARIRAFGMYASGDDDVTDGTGSGFDAILDNPAFAGGEFSFFQRQNIKLLGVGLVQRNSFLPDLTTSKIEGQSNFVNPGLLLLGGAVDFEITPKWRGQIGASYLRFMEPAPLETFLETEDIEQEIGVDLFMGTQYRPLLTNNILITFGAAMLFPGDGYSKIYQSNDEQWQVFLDITLTY